MAIRLPCVLSAKYILRRSIAAATSLDVPKGHFAVYVGEGKKKRFVIPVSVLNQPSFQQLLSIVEEEFGFNHPMGGLTIPCTEDIFLNITSAFRRPWHARTLNFKTVLVLWFFLFTWALYSCRKVYYDAVEFWDITIYVPLWLFFLNYYFNHFVLHVSTLYRSKFFPFTYFLVLYEFCFSSYDLFLKYFLFINDNEYI